VIKFHTPIDLFSPSTQQKVSVPVEAQAVILHKTDEHTTLILMSPEEFKGMLLVGLNPDIEKASAKEDDQKQDILLTPHRNSKSKTVSEWEKILSEVAVELDQRKAPELAQAITSLQAAIGPHRVVKSPYNLGTWYSSLDPTMPIFYIISLESGDTFVIRTPENNNPRRISWLEMKRSNPQPLAIEDMKKLDIHFRPEDFSVSPTKPKYGTP
jgi:hypothetical protein